MTVDVVELFAGPGGLTEGLRMVAPHLRTVGLEWDHSACLTRVANRHPVIRTDVAAYPTEPFRRAGVKVLGGAPPCQTFSMSGKGEGRRHVESIKRAAGLVADGASPADALAAVADEALDERTMLVLQPMRWARDLRPETIVLEEVPAVLPIWEALAYHLHHKLGYHVWTGVLDAECYGVPQTRDRAFLVASRTRRVGRPPATHRKYDKRLPDNGRYGSGEGLFDDGLLPWVSMADALGWGGGRVGFARKDDRGDSPDGYRERDWRGTDEPAFTVTEKARSAERVELRNGTQDNACVRAIDEPAPTITAGHDAGDRQWVAVPAADACQARSWKVIPDGRVRDQTGTPFDEGWPAERPATTLATRDLVQHPGATANRHNGSTKSRNDGIRIEVVEAATLQSFRADYVWRGTRTKQFQQIGNAVPVLLAAHAWAEALGVPAPGATS